MRATYRILALAIALGVVIQAAVIAFAWFQVIHDTDTGAVFDKNAEGNVGHALHGVIGMMIMPLIAIVLLILSFFAKIPGGAKWAGITLGVTALQVLLAFASFGAPVVGALHGINAFALAAVASIAARKARTADEPAVVGAAAPAAVV
jgi:hypothetical protein